MRNNFIGLVLCIIKIVVICCLMKWSRASVISTGNFNEDYYVVWSPDHVITSPDGKSLNLKLDNNSGAGFASREKFLFGQFDMKIKLVPGNSAGTVVAYYLASDQPNHDEIDFEFLGNVPGDTYILQTNVFADGTGDREERINLWFDPTKDFHTYSVLWNLHQIVFMVDWVPIRTYRNYAKKGVPFPRLQPMGIKSTLWNGDNWATSGGKTKIDWSKAPFIASFGNYKLDACVWKRNPRFCWDATSQNWWNKMELSSLNSNQRRLFKWVRKYHLIYDYCQDNQRFMNNLPKECHLPKY